MTSQIKTQARVDQFMSALKIKSVKATPQGRKQICLALGDTARVFKSRLIKAGWVVSEKVNLGDVQCRRVILRNRKVRNAQIVIDIFQGVRSNKAFLMQTK